MIPWSADAKRVPVPGGLADHPDFLRYKSCADNDAGTWFKLSMFCELGLNSGGCLAAQENSKVFRKSFHPLPPPAVRLNIPVQMEAEAARVEGQAHRKAAENKYDPLLKRLARCLPWCPHPAVLR